MFWEFSADICLLGGRTHVRGYSYGEFCLPFVSRNQWEAGIWNFFPQPIGSQDLENVWSRHVGAVSEWGVWFWEPCVVVGRWIFVQQGTSLEFSLGRWGATKWGTTWRWSWRFWGWIDGGGELLEEIFEIRVDFLPGSCLARRLELERLRVGESGARPWAVPCRWDGVGWVNWNGRVSYCT